MISFMALINTYCNSSKQAIVHCVLFLTLGNIIIGLLTEYIWHGFDILAYMLPIVSLMDKLSLSVSVFDSYGAPVIQSTCYLVLAFVCFKRQAV